MLAKAAGLRWWLVQEGIRRCDEGAVAQGAGQSSAEDREGPGMHFLLVLTP